MSVSFTLPTDSIERLKQRAQKLLKLSESHNKSVAGNNIYDKIASLKIPKCTDKNPCCGSGAEQVRDEALGIISGFLSLISSESRDIVNLQK